MLASALAGWTVFAMSVAARPELRVIFIIVAAFALYRAVLFIHEITHVAAHELPGFRAAWNALVGVPLLLRASTRIITGRGTTERRPTPSTFRLGAGRRS